MKKVKLALDWTANTNHSGFYVAREQGFYGNLGITVEIQTPDEDNYQVTPAKKVELGLADVAICPFESIVSYNTKKEKFNALAIASIYREDISAIVTLKESGLDSPKQLDGKSYASYQARYEDGIVAQMVKNDGGEGNIKLAYPDKLGIWETLLTKKYDATWIFMNWEGIHAKAKGVALNTFKLSDYGIPYSYSPVLMAGKERLMQNLDDYKSFLEATKQGFLYAKENPQYAADCIAPFVAKSDRDIDLLESQRFSNRFYGDEQNWGQLEEANVNQFLAWLHQHGLEGSRLRYSDLVYNGFSL